MKTLILFPIAAWLALSGCSSTPPVTRIGSITVVAEERANQSTPTAIDIVFAYDTTSAGMLPRTGPDWFDKKEALVNGLATGIDVVSLGVPPLTTYKVPLPERAGKAIGVYSFADYITPAGQPMGNLTPYKTMTIRLLPDNIVYSGN